MDCPMTEQEDLKDLSCIVLCKSELFYQRADGTTIKTEYPRSEREARERAKAQGVACSFQ
jgi:hypothetical protein